LGRVSMYVCVPIQFDVTVLVYYKGEGREGKGRERAGWRGWRTSDLHAVRTRRFSSQTLCRLQQKQGASSAERPRRDSAFSRQFPFSIEVG
jgi:hypothetical protein